ncbi:MAG: hypothetical protein BWY04_00207 [candidate division CPR1 bacterium ADurb.Bin160]|jgi:hypothetical protein|uniref:Uncharacterized protein n=1 Tax=candidate division CPR1 bacterium ADurb.Bin160 TaxID=1852826 RepID=A0A1V5ZQP4_9BACT|nr:MAG: hypothetical protein BWY04_00207 [candidate division CPR1 bacterium ADurb.Bin160]
MFFKEIGHSTFIIFFQSLKSAIVFSHRHFSEFNHGEYGTPPFMSNINTQPPSIIQHSLFKLSKNSLELSISGRLGCEKLLAEFFIL